MQRFCYCFALFGALSYFQGPLFAEDTPLRTRPNVILMMADDMGMGDTSAFQDFTGNADDVQLHTPNMERLARMGVRFTDAHTPASRCTPTRYGLLTGRYPWRSRLKWWVLFGSQGDPLIEPGRPTLATLFRDHGYGTAMVGKWHVGLRYRQSDGSPAAGWNDADLAQPLHTTPLDHGFDYCRLTSRSHGTSGPDVATQKSRERNTPEQSIGPGHVHGRIAVGATENGKQLVTEGANAFILTKLGSRHSDHAIEWLGKHLSRADTDPKPFFVYYPSNSNHGPHTPDMKIGGKAVKGVARTVSGDPTDTRNNYIYENDVALGRLIDYLEETDDPRNPGQKLVSNTVVIFTSDNGAEKDNNIATGPFRSNKGSCYEGGHRVPFIVAWPGGGIGDGDASTPGQTNATPIGLTDMFATFAEILGNPLPNLAAGEKGAEDSVSALSAMRGEEIERRTPLFFNDHKQATDDPAVLAMRLDSPTVVGDQVFPGHWKVLFDASLLREGSVNPIELYDLSPDQWESENRIHEPNLQPLVQHLNRVAINHRNTGGHRIADADYTGRVVYRWQHKRDGSSALAEQMAAKPASGISVERTLDGGSNLTMTIQGVRGEEALEDATFEPNFRGLGLSGGRLKQVNRGEALLISFDRDVLIESAAIVAGNGVCGGFYQVGDHAPLAIYCVDGDNDSREQQGILSDIGVLPRGAYLRLDSRPHYGVEPAGRWRLGALSVRVLAEQ